MLEDASANPNDLQSYWLPFTPNRSFKERPRLLVKGEGMYYWDKAGRKILDAISGLWCVNAGHAQKSIVAAIQAQAAELDYAPSFHFAHPKVVTLAARLTALAPKGLENVFFCNSGSEAADTAMKIARGYFSAKGQGGRYQFVSRARSYHGVNFGGMSLGGLPNNLKGFGPLVPGTEHRLPLPYDPARDRYSKGEPEGGAGYADALETICAEQGADTIAAVIVEPMTGSGGVFASPKAYLPRLREICDRHGVLMIADEVMAGWGRTGKWFSVDHWNVKPDILVTAKGITSAYVPLGLCATTTKLAEYFEDHYFSHGHTYEAHPITLGPAVATIEEMQRLKLVERAASLEPYVREKLEALKEKHPSIGDVRGLGLFFAVELVKNRKTKEPLNTMRDKVEGKPMVVEQIAAKMMADGVAQQAWVSHFVIAPPLIVTKDEIDLGIATLDKHLAIADALIE